MAHIYNAHDHVEWFDSTAQLANDVEVVTAKTMKAAALDAANVKYISDGEDWFKMADGTKIGYYIMTVTLGDNTSITIADAAGNSYGNGSRILAGTSLTITAAADEGYTLSTYTVDTVDKLLSNPTTHVMNAACAIVTAATEDA